MNILVCVKQVPDTKKIKIDPETNTLVRQGVESILNPFDLFAVEAALRIRDEHGGKVTAITMGPPQAEDVLREVVGLGVDDVALLSDRAFAGADTWATSYALAKAAEKLGPFDIIVCGKQAIDGDTAQVGPGLAERLNLPYVSFVRSINSIKDGTMTVERLMDDGFDEVRFSLPALITVVKEIGQVRVPSFKGKMKAKKLQIEIMSGQEAGADPSLCGLAGSPTKVVKIFAPTPRGESQKWDGDAVELAERVLKKLKEDSIITVAV